MNKKRVIKMLAAHAEELIGRPEAMQQTNLTDEERGQLAPLFQLAEQLHQSMPSVQPSAAFVRNLGSELKERARNRLALKKRWRRVAVIGAATLGSLVSIASLVDIGSKIA
ncbi:MAG: hypothetical protein B6I35_04030 [Anaerolineaceae bacterium 4572_32.2]|nr:MAG: hypothetical protein B6I35_04030 [Anaerolineaceae bacterium 4572_32.2]